MGNLIEQAKAREKRLGIQNNSQTNSHSQTNDALTELFKTEADNITQSVINKNMTPETAQEKTWWEKYADYTDDRVINNKDTKAVNNMFDNVMEAFGVHPVVKENIRRDTNLNNAYIHYKIGDDTKRLMTDEEKNEYNSRRQSDDTASARNYLAAIEPKLNKRWAENSQREVEAIARSGAVGKTMLGISNVASTAAAPIEAAYIAKKTAENPWGAIDVNSPWLRNSAFKEQSHEAITKNMGNVGKGAVDTAISIGETVTASFLSGGNPWIASSIMGSSAAVSTVRDATARGADAKTAAGLGVMAGVTELLTEKIPFDNLFKTFKNTPVKFFSKQTMKAILKQAGIEASEETISQIVNNIADFAIMKDNSHFSLNKKEYMANGMSEKDAEVKSFVNSFITEPLVSGAMGAISGTVMGGGTTALGITANRNSVKNEIKDVFDRLSRAEELDMFDGQSGTPVPTGTENTETEILNKNEGIKVSTQGLSTLIKNTNLARAKFVEFYKTHFPKSVVNLETNSEIGISRRGIDKFLSGNISKEKYATGWKIPELIRTAHKIGEADNKKGKAGISGYEYYQNNIRVDDNDYNVYIRVRNTDMGDKYYGHTISKIVTDIKIEPAARNSEEKSTVHPVNANGSIQETDSPIMTAPQLSVDAVSESVSNENQMQSTTEGLQSPDVVQTHADSNNSIPNPEPIVKGDNSTGIEGEQSVDNSSTTDGHRGESAPSGTPVPTSEQPNVGYGLSENVDISGVEIDPKATGLVKSIVFSDFLAKRFGVKIKYINDPMAANVAGRYESGTIYINVARAGTKTFYEIVGHEFGHAFKQINLRGYRELLTMVKNSVTINRQFLDYRSKVQNRYSKMGIELNGEKLDEVTFEEMLSDIFAETLKNPESIRQIANSDRDFAQKIRDILHTLIDYLDDFFSVRKNENIRNLVRDFDKIEKRITEIVSESEYQEHFDDSNELRYDVVDAESQIRDDTKSFAERVRETLNGSVDRNHVYIGKTTSILKQIGLNPDLPMFITRGHLRDMCHDKVKGETKYHGLSEESVINDLPHILNYPAIVFDSFSENNKGAICLLSERTDSDGLPLLVVIKPDGRGRYNNVTISSNFVLSMYGKDNPQGFINQLASNSKNVIYMDEKRTRDVLKAARLYLPAELSKLKFNTIIHKSNNIVKSKKMDDSTSAYINKKGATQVSRANGLGETSETPTAVTPNDIIHNGEGNVKGNQEPRFAFADDGETEYESSMSDTYKRNVKDIDELVDMSGNVSDTSKIPTKRKLERTKAKVLSEVELIDRQIDACRGVMEDIVSPGYKEAEAKISKLLEERDRLTSVLYKDDVLLELRTRLDGADVERNVDFIINNVDEICGGNKGFIKRLLRDRSYTFTDLERNLKGIFGNAYSYIEENYVKPFMESKKSYAKAVRSLARETAKKMEELGIKVKSLEDAAIMWIGEGEKNPDTGNTEDVLRLERKMKNMGYSDDEIASHRQNGFKNLNIRIPYYEADLFADFGTERAKAIIEASKFFREKYDALIDEINLSQARIYPNRADKLVKKRKDYFHHFTELSNGFGAIKNIFTTDLEINPLLAGISEFTNPKEKWAGFKQQRTGNKTEESAISGFARYIGDAEYAIHINEHIQKFRGLARDIAEAKAMEGDSGANAAITYLNDFANSLAGKTFIIDRVLDRFKYGRKVMRAINWFNLRAKANAVVGNISTMLVQPTNMLNTLQLIENEGDIAKGLADFMAGLSDKEGEIQKRYEMSGFLAERYLDKELTALTGKDLGAWLGSAMNVGDEVGTKISWNAFYNEALRKGEADPIYYADSKTRAAVAGRGIGEAPLAFNSAILKLFLPYRVEVNNNIHVIKDMLSSDKSIGHKVKKSLEFMIASALTSAVLEAITGNGSVFDPLGAVIKGIIQGTDEAEEEEEGTGKAVKLALDYSLKNLAGEAISNAPLGQAVMSIMGIDNDTLDALTNGNVYYSGGMGIPAAGVAANAIKDFAKGDILGGASELALGIGTPYGGNQIKKTVKGIGELARGAAYEKDVLSSADKGKLKYMVEPSASNVIKETMFGPSSLPENDIYYGEQPLSDRVINGKREIAPLSDRETAVVDSYDSFDERKAEYDKIQEEKLLDAKKDKHRENVLREKRASYIENAELNDPGYKLYQKGFKSALPVSLLPESYSWTKNKKKQTKVLTETEKSKWQKELDALTKKKYYALIKTADFKKARPDKQEELIGDIISEAQTEIRKKVLNSR